MIGKRQGKAAGFTLIEVLVTLLIIAIGLLGLAGLQVTSLKNQMEAYQRAQAVMLAEEMAHRMRVNAPAARAGQYTPGLTYGLTKSAGPCDPNNIAAYDLCDWSNLLYGEGITLSGADVGSIQSARGCIENLPSSDYGESRIRVTVAWQGLTSTKAPKSVCGLNAYGDEDAFRRVAIVDAVLADLAGDPNDPNSP